ncbi:hypothetical protein V8F20_007539 [Naviculisporaceae sp. PSN 640]
MSSADAQEPPTQSAKPAAGGQDNHTAPANPISASRDDDITISALELAGDVCSLVRKLAPWKGIMPADLRTFMDDVEEKAQDIDALKPKIDGSLPSEWSPYVMQLSMETWSRDGPFDAKKLRVNKPAIVAYYHSPPSCEGHKGGGEIRLPSAKRAEHATSEDQRNLQRVLILSPDLQDEMRLVTSITLQPPVVIPPPYKILLEYYHDFCARLKQLDDELERSNGQGEKEDANTSLWPSAGSQSPDNDDSSTTNRRNIYLSTRAAHLRCLIVFIQDSLGELLRLRAQVADHTLKEIAFEDLWHLYRPGDTVYYRDPETGLERLAKVYYITGGMIKRRKGHRYSEESDFAQDANPQRTSIAVGCWTPFLLATYTMDFDGNRAGPVGREILIKHYSGKRSIAELPAYPVSYHPEKNLLGRFEKIGRQFMSSAGHRYYDGLAVSVEVCTVPKEKVAGVTVNVRRTYDSIVSEVYVDFVEFFKSFPRITPEFFEGLENPLLDPTENSEDAEPLPRHLHSASLPYRGHEEVDAKLSEIFTANNRRSQEPFDPLLEPGKLTPEFYQLLPQEVPAYAFRHRKFYLVNINQLQPISPSRYSGFDDLVIPDQYKTLLTALVNNHTSASKKRADKLKKHQIVPSTKMDIVPGKGEGLIILLHGPPGAGKTSTAETIAAYTGRPLYSITCGDIGLVPREAENVLEEHTLRADKWGCVLLLDEADVFLMQRTWKEIQRNALVSVFLRQLEYYSGILFLTTNRPGTIDEAFKSRIHVSLRYPGIDLNATRQMWENILTRLEKENETAEIKIEFNREKLLNFAEQHYKRRVASHSCWNGRQIRNAFQTALALGHAARQNLLLEAGITKEDLETALNEEIDSVDEDANKNIKRLKKKYMTVKLTVASFKDIAKTTNEFEDYIVALRGKDSDAQRDNEVRDDAYDPEGSGRGGGRGGAGESGLDPRNANLNMGIGIGRRRGDEYSAGGGGVRTTYMQQQFQQHSPSMSVISATSSSARSGIGGNNAGGGPDGGWERWRSSGGGGGGGDGHLSQGGGSPSPEIILNGGRYVNAVVAGPGNSGLSRGSVAARPNRYGVDSSEHDDDDEEFDEDDDDY